MEKEAEKTKKSGFQFWKETLQSAKYVVAPMVDQSELAWRILSRRYGAELCYTPMLHASIFSKDANYRRDSLQTCPEDRPLIIQFCANDPQTLLKAAQIAVEECECDGVDLNLGCPQVIAKRGHYGAFLQEEWDLVEKMVKLCHEKLKVNITCKIRILESIERTIEYAKMLEAAGCQLLTVHGRTREQRGRLTGIADWSYIKAVREAVSIPVFANGNIQYLSDVGQCMEETGVQGVMTAEGNLHNPALFHGKQPCVWDMAFEYLDIVDQYPCSLSYVRGHIFKISQHALNIHRDVRDIVASGKTVQEFRDAIKMLEEACQGPMKDYETNGEAYASELEAYPSMLKLPFPYWICQPYVRPSVDEVKDESKRELRLQLNRKRSLDMQKISEGYPGLSINKLKKMLRNPHKNYDKESKKEDKCQKCPNIKGVKCEFGMCKSCCRQKAYEKDLHCKAHNTKIKHDPKRERFKLENSDNKPSLDTSRIADIGATESRIEDTRATECTDYPTKDVENEETECENKAGLCNDETTFENTQKCFEESLILDTDKVS